MIVMHHVLKFFIHTWHMHGYRFAVVKVVYPPRDPQTDLVMTTCMYKRSNIVSFKFNFSHEVKVSHTRALPTVF